jgi:cell division septation protein DedD
MTRMADPERRRGELEDDEARFEDEGRRSIFSALWFRTILVVVVLGVVAAVAVPYILELANQPPPKPTIVVRPEPLAPPPAPVAPPPASPGTTPVPPPAAEKPPVVEKPPVAERPAPSPPMSASEKPAAAKKADASKSAVAKEPAAPRSTKATAAKVVAAPGGAYFVQVGAFKSQESAKRLATRMRELKYNVEESSMSGAQPGRSDAASPRAGAAPAGSDRYDVYVTGGAPGDITAKLTAKGFTAEPSSGGVVVKPSLPLRDAVALSKDLAVDGLKVQVRRAGTSAPASAPAAGGAAMSGGASLYRIRVGPFDDRAAATSTLRELEQRGYTPFIARGGQ